MIELDQMSKILAVEYLGFPSVNLTPELTKYWQGYFEIYDPATFTKAFRWATRTLATGFPPTIGQVQEHILASLPPKLALPPVKIAPSQSEKEIMEVDKIFNYWGAEGYHKMLLELLKDIAPTVQIDPTSAARVLKLCQVKGWAEKYKVWKIEQLEMITFLKANP